MQEDKPRPLARKVVLGAAAVAFTTWVGYRLQLNVATKLCAEQRNIGSLVTRIVGQYANRADGRRVIIRENDGTAEAVVDAELLSLALSQLLDNATKYSCAGSSVTVSLTSEKNFVTIRVSNTGSSIPDEAKGRIFERFYRGANAQQLTPGSGLGLYVARKIALAHGGSLEVDDDDRLSEKTVFALTLPVPKMGSAQESDEAQAGVSFMVSAI
jgi:signal transduction histidine kinase